MMNRMIMVNDKKYSFNCRTESNYNGFKHIATLYIDDNCVSKSSRQYYNRTWERYEYQSVMIDLIKEQMEVLDSWYLDKFKTEKGYKNMTEKRKWEFATYIGCNREYREELKELQYVLDNLENESC